MERRTLAERWGGKDREANLGGEEWWQGVAAGRELQERVAKVSLMASDGNECGCTRKRVCNECECARARGHVHEGASTRACARRQLVHARARAPADAGANRINGRALLAASRLDSREDGKATHLEQSWR